MFDTRELVLLGCVKWSSPHGCVAAYFGGTVMEIELLELLRRVI